MVIKISLNIFPLNNDIITLSQDKLKRKVLNKNITKVLGPLVTQKSFDGDLDLDEYNSSI